MTNAYNAIDKAQLRLESFVRREETPETFYEAFLGTVCRSQASTFKEAYDRTRREWEIRKMSGEIPPRGTLRRAFNKNAVCVNLEKYVKRQPYGNAAKTEQRKIGA